MTRRVLHLLSQRPGRTGSGVTLQALTREAAAAGWEQAVVVGTPADDPHPDIDGVTPASVHPLRFGTPRLQYALPGMSDVMPYESSRWRDLSPEQLDSYRGAWRAHLGSVIEQFRPDVIHSHHAWLLSALVRDLAPDTPLVVHVHATGLRQMELCPHLANEVRTGVSRADRLLVLTHEMGRRVQAALDVDEERIAVVGAGYRDDVFDARGIRSPAPRAILYVGKYSRAKGLPWLLDAFERVAARDEDAPLREQAVLHVAGSGAGSEADALRERMRALAPRVVLHGHLNQPELASLMRRCELFVLPSLYEGLPLVLVEAVASFLVAICTALPAVREEVAPHLGEALNLVPMPRLRGVDEPYEEDLPAFVDELEAALIQGLQPRPRGGWTGPPDLQAFTWGAVFQRVERVWEEAAVKGQNGKLSGGAGR